MSRRWLASALALAAACAAPAEPPPATQADTAPAQLTLTVRFSTGSSGRIYSSPAGIACPGICSADFPAGTRVTLNAIPVDGAAFDGWQAPCGADTLCSVEMTSPQQRSAAFHDLLCGQLLYPAQPFTVSMTTFSARRCEAGLADAAGTPIFAARSTFSTALLFVDAQTRDQAAVYMPASLAMMPQPFGAIGIDGSRLWSYTRTGWVRAVRSSIYSLPLSTTSGLGGGVVEVGGGSPTVPCTIRVDQSETLEAIWSGTCAATGAVVGVGVDGDGNLLVMTQSPTPGVITGQWWSSTKGAALTGAFTLFSGFEGGAGTWLQAFPLIGSGLAIRRVDPLGAASPFPATRWIGIARPAPESAAPPPDWLVSRPDTSLAIAYHGAAYALVPDPSASGDCEKRIELVTPKGDSCGGWSFGPTSCASTLSVGEDGSVIQGEREENEVADATGARSCTWHVHPHLLGY